MDQPRLEACYFPNPDPAKALVYERLAAVLGYTARRHCPDWAINVERLDGITFKSAAKTSNPSHEWNTQKLEFWNRQIQAAPDGARILLIDGDTYVAKSLDDVWSIDFDLAYTIRNGGGTALPFNGGVVFVRVCPSTRAFMQKWWETNLRFLGDPDAHRRWRLKYAGINQASFGFMLERVQHGLDIHKLRCAEWNLCEWDAFDHESARIVHVKSGLRRAVFSLRPASWVHPKVRDLARVWMRIEKEMLAEREAVA